MVKKHPTVGPWTLLLNQDPPEADFYECLRAESTDSFVIRRMQWDGRYWHLIDEAGAPRREQAIPPRYWRHTYTHWHFADNGYN